MAHIKLTDVRKSFGALEVIKGVDMEIRSGEFMVFVGPSGCGKSTLLRLISGLEDITAGTLAFDGEVMNQLAPAKRGIAMVFQSYALYPHMTVFDNMAFGMKLAGQDKAERDRRVREAAEMLQLTPYLERLPRQLSGGQRQRVAIGRAIVRDPRVFLFDEPLSNLDAALRVATRLEIAKLHRSMHNTTMIYVTHDQVEAMTLADRICVLRDGVVEQIGTPLELYESPNSLFVAGFIGSPKMNFLDGRFSEPHGAHTIGIRAEHLTIETEGRWQGSVVHSEMLGSDSYVYVDIGGDEPLVVRQEGTATLRPGETVAVTPDDHELHRFDLGGRAIGRGLMKGAA
jgi:multiple sugar transport system ATP-binding protein